MKLSRWAFLFLAATVGLFGQRADASYTRLDTGLHAHKTALLQTTATATAELQADEWLVESITPLGLTDDGQPIALVSLLVPTTSLDELTPASTRAGPYAAPETHTRVFCIVQPPLGLWSLKGNRAIAEHGDGMSDLSQILFGDPNLYKRLPLPASGNYDILREGESIDVTRWIVPIREIVEAYFTDTARVAHLHEIAGVRPWIPQYLTKFAERTQFGVQKTKLGISVANTYASASRLLNVPRLSKPPSTWGPFLAVVGQQIIVAQCLLEGDDEGALRHGSYGVGSAVGALVAGSNPLVGGGIVALFGFSSLGDVLATAQQREMVEQSAFNALEVHTALTRMARMQARPIKARLDRNAETVEKAMHVLDELGEQPVIESDSRDGWILFFRQNR